MKVKVLALSLVGMLSVSAMAQEVSDATYVPNEPGKNVSFKKNRASDNWFIQLQGGINVVNRANDQKSGAAGKELELKHRPALSLGLGFGKWHNPYFGTRLMIDYNELHHFDNAFPARMFKSKSLNPHFDFMFDVFNYFGEYNPNRVFSLRPYLGVGWGVSQIIAPLDSWEPTKLYTDNKNFIHSATANLGVSLDFRLAKRLTFNVGAGAAIGNFTNIYNNKYYKPQEVIGQIRAGFTFGAGRQDWEAVEPMDYALLNDLNSQINSLRAQNEELSKRPVSCPECPEVQPVATVNNIVDNVVYFRLNSARVDANQLLNIYNTAEFVKANNAPIIVVGYADEQTGTAEYNMQLSERRAREVARLLVDEYGVPSNLITIDFKGSSEQIYSKNAWNRVVIMKANN